MADKSGSFSAKKLSGEAYFRASFTFKNKHISLGSFDSEEKAHQAYLDAKELSASQLGVYDYNSSLRTLSFEKWVSIVNFRDNGLYFKNPIYIYPKYFEYFYDENTVYKFNVDDLFFFSNHKLMKRGSHLFVSEYGMQTSILGRYGIKKHAVIGKDYEFVNGDEYDLRYENIRIINRYNGVSRSVKNGRDLFTSRILINGSFIIGRYPDEASAAVAYNKAIDILSSKGIGHSYEKNYISDLNSIEYARIYNKVKISRKILDYKA